MEQREQRPNVFGLCRVATEVGAAKSTSEVLAAPSAMLELMDTAALCNWSQRPFFSNHGNLPVTSYTQVAKLTASFHTEYSLKFLAPAIVKVKVIVKVVYFD